MMNRLVIFTLLAALLTFVSTPFLAQSESTDVAEESFDDKLNNIMGPVTDAVNAVVFYSLPYGEEVTIEKYDAETDGYRLDFNEASPQIALDQVNDPLKGTAIVLEGTDSGTQLSYQIIEQGDTTAIVVPNVSFGDNITLNLAEGKTTVVVLSGDQPAVG